MHHADPLHKSVLVQQAYLWACCSTTFTSLSLVHATNNCWLYDLRKCQVKIEAARLINYLLTIKHYVIK